jgi:hypothetical protein
MVSSNTCGGPLTRIAKSLMFSFSRAVMVLLQSVSLGGY